MELKITQTIDRETLENVCVNALEGGSNYWYYLSDQAVEMIRKAVPQDKNPYLSMAILEAVLDHNVAVPINDAHDEEEVIGLFSMTTLQNRLQQLADSKEYKWALQREMDGEGDADSSDVVFQYMTMGEVVYG